MKEPSKMTPEREPLVIRVGSLFIASQDLRPPVAGQVLMIILNHLSLKSLRAVIEDIETSYPELKDDRT